MVATPPVFGIIPARGGSKGIPKKNIKDFCGKPLLAWTIDQLKAAGVTDVLVSTDSQEIATISETYGAKVVVRPESIAGDLSSSEEALLHVIQELDLPKDSVLVFAQATSPLRRSSDVREALSVYFQSDCDSLFSAVRIDDLTAWTVSERRLMPIVGAMGGGRLARQGRPATYIETGSFYIFSTASILESGSRLSGFKQPFEVPKYTFHELDDESDWSWMEGLMRVTEIDLGEKIG